MADQQAFEEEPFEGEFPFEEDFEGFGPDEDLESLFEFEEDLDSLGFEAEEAWLGEVNRRSREYKKWVQRSLNQILGTRLAIDGIIGRRTRSAVRTFQRRARASLGVDGIVGSRTERALIRAGASPPRAGKIARHAPAPTAPPLVPTRANLKQVARRGFKLLGEQQKVGYVLPPHKTQRLKCLMLRMLWRDVDDRYVTAQSVLTYFNQPKPSPWYTWSRVRKTLTIQSLFGPTVPDEKFLRRLEFLDRTIIDGRYKINQLFAQQGIAVSHGVRLIRKWVTDRQKEHRSIYRCYRG